MPADAADDIEAKVQVCAACHGQNGVPIDPENHSDHLGPAASYLYKELHDYQSGARDNPDHVAPRQGSVAGRPAQDRGLLRRPRAGRRNPPAPAAAAPPEGIAQCRLCHQPNFEGGPPAPRLAGLSYEYLVGAMRSFADDKRTNNLDMPGFMRALSESDRDAMARYLAGL